MKKYLFLALFASIFVGCSSDGSREIQIDEVEFVRGYESYPMEQFAKVSSIFEVVPGKYSLSWRLVNDLPQMQNYNIELKLKLRLKKTVKVLPEVFEKMGNASYEGTNKNNVSCPFSFILLDANGKPEKTIVQKLSIDYLPLEDRQGKGTYNKDQMMDFINFLASKPGTEIDIVCNIIGMKSGPNDCVEIVKNARGIQCVMNDVDSQFERMIGTIVE